MIIECSCNGAEQIFVGSTSKMQEGCVCEQQKRWRWIYYKFLNFRLHVGEFFNLGNVEFQISPLWRSVNKCELFLFESWSRYQNERMSEEHVEVNRTTLMRYTNITDLCSSLLLNVDAIVFSFSWVNPKNTSRTRFCLRIVVSNLCIGYRTWS